MSVQSLTHNGITWYHSENPTLEELSKLEHTYHFHKLDIEDCLSDSERPKIEEYENYLFFIFHFPAKIGSRIVKEELNAFVGKDFIVTLGEGKSETLTRLFQSIKGSPKKKEEYLQEGTGFFLYRILDALFDRGFPLIDTLVRDLRRIEVELFEKEEGKINILRDVLTLKRNIITMRSILFPERAVIVSLQHKNKEIIPADLNIYFDDVSDAIERQWSLLDTAKELSDVLQDTHESWLGHRTNEIIRILTIFSVTIAPLTFITGLYGMNISLPFQQHPEAFAILLGGMMAVVGALIGYFVWRKWL